MTDEHSDEHLAYDPVTGEDTPGVAGDEEHRMHDNDNVDVLVTDGVHEPMPPAAFDA